MKRSQVIGIHLLFWFMMVVVPNILFHLDDSRHGPEIGHIIQQVILNIIIFYLTYWIFIPLILKRKRLWELLMFSVGWLLLLLTLRMAASYYYREILNPLQGPYFVFERHLVRDLFGTLMFCLYPVLIYFSIEWFRERQYRFELAREKQRSELDLLKSQINPHFLMNTLNNLYSLVYKGSDKASEAVLKLSDIMRYMLYETKNDLVPLEQEIGYLRSFIDLQMLRLSNKGVVDFNVTGATEGRQVAPMLFIPFVENAFKHGNKQHESHAIRISFNINEERIHFEITNLKLSIETDKDRESGIGLANVKKRLLLQYPDKHQLSIEENSHTFSVNLVIFDR